MQSHYFRVAMRYYLFPALLLVSQMAFAEGMFIPRPDPGLVTDVGKGRALFQQNCSSCHGADLRGTNQGPPMLHRVYVASHHSDAAFQLAVKNGVMPHHWPFGNMPAVPGLNSNDVAQITAYVRAEQVKAGIK